MRGPGGTAGSAAGGPSVSVPKEPQEEKGVLPTQCWKDRGAAHRLGPWSLTALGMKSPSGCIVDPSVRPGTVRLLGESHRTSVLPWFRQRCPRIMSH